MFLNQVAETPNTGGVNGSKRLRKDEYDQSVISTSKPDLIYLLKTALKALTNQATVGSKINCDMTTGWGASLTQKIEVKKSNRSSTRSRGSVSQSLEESQNNVSKEATSFYHDPIDGSAIL
jgi:hypothetical protein